jgi:hypothetical protein
MIKLVNVRVRSFDLSYLDVYWDIAPCHEDIADYQFIVERSTNEFGPYVAVTSPLVNQFHVRDFTVTGQHSFYHKMWYRVRAQYREEAKRTVDGSSTDTVTPELGGARLSAAPDLTALEMARLSNLRLQEFSGRVMWVYPRKTTGAYCPVCLDKVLQRRTRGNCAPCFGTGWIGGYYAPVRSYGTVLTPDERSNSASFSAFQAQDTLLLFGNYPELFEGDVVLEAENVRWRVGETITKVKKSRALVRQQAAIHEISKGDVEYSLPFNMSDEGIRDLVASPSRNFTNPHSLGGDSLTRALTGVFGGRS